MNSFRKREEAGGGGKRQRGINKKNRERKAERWREKKRERVKEMEKESSSIKNSSATRKKYGNDELSLVTQMEDSEKDYERLRNSNLLRIKKIM